MSTFTEEQINQIRELVREEIRQELIDNLKISIDSRPTSDYYSKGTEVVVKMILDGEVISSSDYSIWESRDNY